MAQSKLEEVCTSIRDPLAEVSPKIGLIQFIPYGP